MISYAAYVPTFVMPARMNAKNMLSTAWSIVEGAPTCVENAQLPVRRWQLWAIKGGYFVIKEGVSYFMFEKGTWFRDALLLRPLMGGGCSSMFVC